MAFSIRRVHLVGDECIDAHQIRSALYLAAFEAVQKSFPFLSLRTDLTQGYASPSDFMELPGAACIWASYSYSEKVYVKLVTPIVVAFFLGWPVVAAWMMLKHAAAKRQARGRHGSRQPSTETDTQQEILWRHRYDRTVDVFWNNIVSSLKRT